MVTSWVAKVVFECTEGANSLRVFLPQIGTAKVLFTLMKKAVFALTTCILALVGAILGSIKGAMEGLTTETGFVRGAGIGAVAGAVSAILSMDVMLSGEPFSKVALLYSLVNGEVFAEWVSSSIEISLGGMADICEVTAARGLPQDYINKLPKHIFPSTTNCSEPTCHDTTCTVCLQDLKKGDCSRTLPKCRHLFHLQCIDEWLTQQGSCPICRQEI